MLISFILCRPGKGRKLCGPHTVPVLHILVVVGRTQCNPILHLSTRPPPVPTSSDQPLLAMANSPSFHCCVRFRWKTLFRKRKVLWLECRIRERDEPGAQGELPPRRRGRSQRGRGRGRVPLKPKPPPGRRGDNHISIKSSPPPQPPTQI